MVLYPAVSLVSINPAGSHNHPARDARALAQGRLSLLLALEVAPTGRATPDRHGTARIASPWQNGFAERLIGSIRCECVDHIIVLGEMHLRRVLKSYADYYNCVRTHHAGRRTHYSGPADGLPRHRKQSIPESRLIKGNGPCQPISVQLWRGG